LTRGFGVLAALALSLTVAACGGDPDAGPSGGSTSAGGTTAPTSPSPSPSTSAASGGEPLTLTFGVYGNASQVSAYRRIAEAYTDIDPDLTLKIRSWPDEDTMVTDLASGGDVPDVFLTPDASLSELIATGINQPVDTYLDARSVDLGDGYSRTAIQDFSRDKRLQCMPYLVSPEVVYVNTDLVDFDTMAKRGLPTPGKDSDSWSLEQFQAAVKFASKPRKGIRGLYVDPTVSGLTPWLVGAGGSLLDDAASPTQTAFADSQDALSQLLPILSNGRFRLPVAAKEHDRALSWFKRGKLATMVGTRSLVPTLRATKGLHWDVMSMPGDGGSTGDYTGLCMSAHPSDADAAADFLAYLITSDAVGKLTRSGSVVPVNQQVAYANSFLQPNRAPSHASVFTDALKGMYALPSVRVLDQLERAVGPQVRRLLTAKGQDNLERLTGRIDDNSRSVFGGPTASPTS